MQIEISPTRRGLMIGAAQACAALALAGTAAASETLPKLTVTRDPNCGCCGNWVEHMKAAGFPVDVVETSELNQVKVRLGVPQNLASCHTAEVAGYVIEGHVPASAIKRLLVEHPNAKGLAVSGMPVGAPGMEAEGAAIETYEVILFGPGGQRRFARYHGVQEV